MARISGGSTIICRLPLYCLLFFLCLPTLTHAKIVFHSVIRGAGAGLYVMDDDGRNVQRLTASHGWFPEWSPDGRQIAFTAQPPGVPNWPQIRAIYIINSDGTDEYRLTDEDTREGGRPGLRMVNTSPSRVIDFPNLEWCRLTSGG